MESHDIIDLIIKLLVIVIPIIWAIVKVKLKLDEGKAKKITIIVEQAVNETYHEYIRLKKNGANGETRKLTPEEIKEAQETAWGKALRIAESRGMRLAQEVAQEYFPVLIDKAIKGFTKGG